MGMTARAQQSFFVAGLGDEDHDEQAPNRVSLAVVVHVPRSLSAAEMHERDVALEAQRAARARWRIGDLREADNPCPACGNERLERLEDIAAEGGQTWVVMCTTLGCIRCRSQHAAPGRAGAEQGALR
jgi:hypothetical protein